MSNYIVLYVCVTCFALFVAAICYNGKELNKILAWAFFWPLLIILMSIKGFIEVLDD